MGISPRTQGDLSPGFTFIFTDDANAIVDVSGQSGNFSVILKPTPGVDQPGVVKITGTGVFSYATDGTDGKVKYAPVLADVNTPGQYLVYGICNFNGTKPMTSDPMPLMITPKP